MKLYLIIPLFLSIVSCSALNEYEKKFVEQHEPSQEVKEKLEKCFKNLPRELKNLLAGEVPLKSRDDLIKLFNNAGFTVKVLVASEVNLSKNHHCVSHVVLQHKDIPGYFLKLGFDKFIHRAVISRIIVADFINMLIDNQFLKITLMGKVEKKIYHRPDMPFDLEDKNYIVLSPSIDGVQLGYRNEQGEILFTSQECKEIYEYFIKSRESFFIRIFLDKNCDFSPNNFVVDNQGKIFLIDTEPRGDDMYNLTSASNVLLALILEE